MKIVNYISSAIAIAIALDITIVAWTMLQIASGAPTPHIPFWDAQIKAILTLMH